MFKKIEAANTNIEQTVEDVLKNFILEPSQRDIIARAANKALDDLPESEIPGFLMNLKDRIESISEPIVESHIQDIMLAVKATLTGKELGYYSHRISPEAAQDLVDNLAA